MHDCMPLPYDPIQGQGQFHGASEVPTMTLFKVYLLRHLQWELASDQRSNYGTICEFVRAEFLILSYFCVT